VSTKAHFQLFSLCLLSLALSRFFSLFGGGNISSLFWTFPLSFSRLTLLFYNPDVPNAIPCPEAVSSDFRFIMVPLRLQYSVLK
jgi:hypothetical protein